MSTQAVSEAIPDERVSRWSLTMAFWGMFSAMFWLYIAVASNAAVGTVNTIVGMVLTVITYGVIMQSCRVTPSRPGRPSACSRRVSSAPLDPV